jgi:hypothetical protein
LAKIETPNDMKRIAWNWIVWLAVLALTAGPGRISAQDRTRSAKPTTNTPPQTAIARSDTETQALQMLEVINKGNTVAAGEFVRAHFGIDSELQIFWNGPYTVVVMSNYDAPGGTSLARAISEFLSRQMALGPS